MTVKLIDSPLRLGSVVLDEYLIPLEEPTEFSFPEIDPSFLKMQDTLKIKRYNVPLPKFSVYPVYGSLFFNIGFRKFKTDSHSENYLCSTGLPLELEKLLLDGTRKFVSDDSSSFWRIMVPRIGNVNVYSMFSGVVPKETEKEIYMAGEVFNRNDLYYVKETKPEDWKVEFLSDSESFLKRAQRLAFERDPLVLGVKNGKYFVVDRFDVTPWEEYAEKKFGTRSI